MSGPWPKSIKTIVAPRHAVKSGLQERSFVCFGATKRIELEYVTGRVICYSLPSLLPMEPSLGRASHEMEVPVPVVYGHGPSPCHGEMSYGAPFIFSDQHHHHVKRYINRFTERYRASCAGSAAGRSRLLTTSASCRPESSGE